MPLTRLPNRACARVGHLRCPDITLLERGWSSGDEGSGGGEESDDGGGELHVERERIKKGKLVVKKYTSGGRRRS